MGNCRIVGVQPLGFWRNLTHFVGVIIDPSWRTDVKSTGKSRPLTMSRCMFLIENGGG